MRIDINAPRDSFIVGPYTDGSYEVVPVGGWIPVDQLGLDVPSELVRDGHVYAEDVAICTVGELIDILNSIIDKIELLDEDGNLIGMLSDRFGSTSKKEVA